MADEGYDVTGDGGQAVNHAGGRVAFARTQKPDHEPTQVRMPAGLVREFHDWYASQYPGVKQLPKADTYIAKVFAHGLAAYKEAFPPIESLDDKVAAFGKAS